MPPNATNSEQVDQTHGHSDEARPEKISAQ